MAKTVSSQRSKDAGQRQGGDATFGSNAVRLSGRQWGVAAGILVVSFWWVPTIWEQFEQIDADADYRIPYQLSNDYWLYGRVCRLAVSQGKTPVVGDSVVWGQYVPEDETLSHHLNAQAEKHGGGEARFANLGVDGSHPAALAGMLGYFGDAISSRSVILHCNPLWMTSKKHDLQTTKEFRFNHPRLVPQFFPDIACYTAPLDERLGIVVERYVPLFSWAGHLQTAYLDNKGLASWTMSRPYENPIGAITLHVPPSAKKLDATPRPWTQRGMDRADFRWVDLATSFQWQSFRGSIETLTGRGNRVFVVVGPFNEHMLKGQSVKTYAELRRGMAEWLRSEGIAHFIPPVLPSEHYADASHPLGVGYAMLAEQLFEDAAFIRFFGVEKQADRMSDLDGRRLALLP